MENTTASTPAQSSCGVTNESMQADSGFNENITSRELSEPIKPDNKIADNKPSESSQSLDPENDKDSSSTLSNTNESTHTEHNDKLNPPPEVTDTVQTDSEFVENCELVQQQSHIDKSDLCSVSRSESQNTEVNTPKVSDKAQRNTECGILDEPLQKKNYTDRNSLTTSSNTNSVAALPTSSEREPEGVKNCTRLDQQQSDIDQQKQPSVSRIDPKNTEMSTPVEVIDEAQKEPEQDVSLNELLQKHPHSSQASASKSDSVHVLPESAHTDVDVVTPSTQQTVRSLIDRIDFEVPIITDNAASCQSFNVPSTTDVIPGASQSETAKSIYTEITGPSFYDVPTNLATLPIITKNLPAQFASLPVFGAPDKKEELPKFYDDKIREFVGNDLTNDEFEKLAKYCSPDHLKTGAEISLSGKHPTPGLLPQDSDEKKVLEKACKFNNVTNLCIHKKYKLRVDKDIALHYNRRLKYRGIRMMQLGCEDSNKDSSEEPQLVPGKDMLFYVRIYRPYDYNIKCFRGRSRHAVFCCDAVVAGRQPLTALRDRFVCANDVGLRVDVADNPHLVSTSNAKDAFPSGFMFINNVFYVDTRVGCVDHAAGVRAWAARRGLGDFPARDMGTPLQDVVLRLGYPEVYVHQGNCEHLFTFSEVRLVGAADPLRARTYPQCASAGSLQAVYCTTCAEFCAKWIVVGCARVPFDPAFFCETCFRLYLYKDGKKIGDFKAFCYRGNEINVMRPDLI